MCLAIQGYFLPSTMSTTINDLPYDCLDRVLAVADETQELKREVARLKAREKFLMKRNIILTAKNRALEDQKLFDKARAKLLIERNISLTVREKHLMECNASMTPSVVMERNIILKARETHLLECNAGLKANETILFECNTSLKARETSLMECNARLRYRLEAATAVLETTTAIAEKNRALEDKLTRMTDPVPCAAPRLVEARACGRGAEVR